MAEPIRLGIIGAGLAAKLLHWPALQQMRDKYAVVAVADINETAARETAALVGAASIFTDYRALLALQEVEAVLLALPIHLTAPLTLEAARASKHVLLEKPLGSNLEQARQLKEQLAHLPVTALVAENFRYRPDIVRAQQLLGEGRLGEIILLRLHSVSRVDTTNPQEFGSTPWRHDIQYRGGPLLDGGVHHAAALRMLGGDVEWVQAFTKYGGSKLGGPTTISMNLRFRSGALGSYVHSAVCHDQQSSFLGLTIYGTDGTLELGDGTLRLYRPGEPGEDFEVDPADGGYRAEFLNFYAALREGQAVVATAEESYRDMELILRALDSAEQAQVILL